MNPLEFLNIARAEKQLWWYRGMHKILFRLLDPIAAARRAGRVLDAGCGTGYFARLLEERYGWQVYPVDRAPEGLVYARGLGLDGLVQADVGRLPFPSGCFDLLLALDVIVHFARGEEGKALAELVRVLAPGGIMVIRAAALDILRSRHSQFTMERQRFTRHRLNQLARQYGVRTLRCTYANSLLLPVALARFRVWEPLLRKPPASGVALLPGWLDKMLYLPLALESAWIGAGLNLPLGQSLILIAWKPASDDRLPSRTRAASQ